MFSTGELRKLRQMKVKIESGPARTLCLPAPQLPPSGMLQGRCPTAAPRSQGLGDFVVVGQRLDSHLGG